MLKSEAGHGDDRQGEKERLSFEDREHHGRQRDEHPAGETRPGDESAFPRAARAAHLPKRFERPRDREQDWQEQDEFSHYALIPLPGRPLLQPATAAANTTGKARCSRRAL